MSAHPRAYSVAVSEEYVPADGILILRKSSNLLTRERLQMKICRRVQHNDSE